MTACEPTAHQFMDLMVPEYAYMFGFLQADGHLSKGTGQKGRLSVELNARDIDLLNAFQQLTPYYSSIRKRTRSTNFSEQHHSAIWTLCSLEARTTLNRLGLPYGRKSQTIEPPQVPFSARDYVRGLIDADGSVGLTGVGFPFVSVTTLSEAIGAYVCSYAQQVTGAERTLKRNTRDGIYNILYTKENAQKLAIDLYYPRSLPLARKQAAASALSEWVRPAEMRIAPQRKRWTEREDHVLLRLNNNAEAASALGRTEKSCGIRLWRLRNGLVPTAKGQ
ncbi:hypothetical protein [Streptomyces sp. NPDC059781]|uniref:hypothetical protein n=1 Tax=Streptomyces sp. NPDC059781 TaxID=3346943 RepID=UPI00365653E7